MNLQRIPVDATPTKRQDNFKYSLHPNHEDTLKIYPQWQRLRHRWHCLWIESWILIDQERMADVCGSNRWMQKTKDPKVVEKPVPHGTERQAVPFSRVHNIHDSTVTRCLMTIQDCPVCEERICSRRLGWNWDPGQAASCKQLNVTSLAWITLDKGKQRQLLPGRVSQKTNTDHGISVLIYFKETRPQVKCRLIEGFYFDYSWCQLLIIESDNGPYLVIIANSAPKSSLGENPGPISGVNAGSGVVT